MNSYVPPVCDKEKLAELVLYVSKKMESDQFAGAIKLNKVLFFSDFLFFRRFQKSITGAEYQKLPLGPAPRELLEARKSLIDTNSADLIETDILGYKQDRLISKREIRLEMFTAKELEYVNTITDLFRDKTAKEVSDLSHDWSIGWQIADLYETIPYTTTFLGTSQITQEESQSIVIALNLENVA
jgi:Protein of unknown function (DUF4065)